MLEDDIDVLEDDIDVLEHGIDALEYNLYALASVWTKNFFSQENVFPFMEVKNVNAGGYNYLSDRFFFAEAKFQLKYMFLKYIGTPPVCFSGAKALVWELSSRNYRWDICDTFRVPSVICFELTLSDIEFLVPGV